MSTPTCGFRAIDGTYHAMKPDCDRRNAIIYAGRLPANLERGIALDGTYWPPELECKRHNIAVEEGSVRTNEDEIIAARVNDYFTKGIPEPFRVTDEKIIIRGESVERLWFLGWMFACAATGLATGTVVGVIINQLW